jgi:hypothetical protein
MREHLQRMRARVNELYDRCLDKRGAHELLGILSDINQAERIYEAEQKEKVA